MQPPGDPAATQLGAHRAPALVAAPKECAPRALIIVLPGGGVAYDKQWAATWLPLPGLPAVRAYVDLPLHGARLATDLRERWRGARVSRFFAPAILGMAAELPSIIDELMARFALPATTPVGVCGWSIGGLAAFLAALDEPRITVLAGFAIPGGGVHHLRLRERSKDPDESTWLARLDLLGRASELAPTPALLMHGDDDDWVDAASSRTLHAALASAYVAAPDRLRYVEYPGVAHDPCACAAEPRRRIAADIGAWLAAHLPG
jgi:pimeloyl-ACP methyl ester carboxylesterase